MIYYAKVFPEDDISPKVMSLWKEMPEERRERSLRFRRRKDFARCVFAYGLLRHALYAEYGLRPGRIQREPAHGKPYFCDVRFPYFNLSHSGNYIACALSDSEVGIDVQTSDEMDVLLADRILSAQEQSLFTGNDKKAALTRAWALKESRLKMSGEGLATDMRTISLAHHREWDFKEDQLYYMVRSVEDCFISVCSPKPIVQKELISVGINELFPGTV